MFDRVRTRRHFKAGGLKALAAPRHVCAWLAIVGLYVQLFAAGFCTAGVNPAFADDGLTAFPICHSQGSAENSATQQGDNAPTQHSTCPFCAIHCNAVMVITPSLIALVSAAIVSVKLERASFAVPPPALFFAGASPRGPPISA